MAEPLANYFGQVLKAQVRPRADQQGVLDDVLELTDVPWPRERLEARQGLGANVVDTSVEFAIEARDHSLHQERDVFNARVGAAGVSA